MHGGFAGKSLIDQTVNFVRKMPMEPDAVI